MSRKAWLALALAAALGVAVLVLDDDVREGAVALTGKAAFATDMYAAIGDELPALPLASRLIILAHAVYESGWGTARAAVRGRNVFNLTAGSAWRGPSWSDVGGDLEYGAAGVTRITQQWRIYGSLREAVRDYWSFLGPNANRGRYVKARAQLEAGNVTAFAHELYAAGYYTLPPEKYAAQLSAVLDTVRRIGIG